MANPFLTPGFLTNDPFGAPKSLDQIPPAPDKLSEEEIFIEFGDALVHRFLGIPLTAEEKEALLFLGILVDPIEIDPPAAGRGQTDRSRRLILTSLRHRRPGKAAILPAI